MNRNKEIAGMMVQVPGRVASFTLCLTVAALYTILSSCSHLRVSDHSATGITVTVSEPSDAPFVMMAPQHNHTTGNRYRVSCDFLNTSDVDVTGLHLWLLVYYPDRKDPVLFEHIEEILVPSKAYRSVSWNIEHDATEEPISVHLAAYSVRFADGTIWTPPIRHYIKQQEEPTPPASTPDTPPEEKMHLPGLEHIEKKVYRAERVQHNPPVVDGVPDDPAWADGQRVGDLLQRSPYEGAPPTGQTAFKILYDNKNLYVAIRAYDPDVQRIERRGTRRDNIEGDWVEIHLDSYNDTRTAFNFTVSAAGVKGDMLIAEDGFRRDANRGPRVIHRSCPGYRGLDRRDADSPGSTPFQ